ncbi:hypothetical protein [Salinisphaera aquimarina]|uniref:Uncharacterized protein n=1 Tax=Salinisphaera aquimarina TaxID=2094031 RepID=A0ABV7EM80_9GAMM
MARLLGLLFLLGLGWLVVKRLLGPEPVARDKPQPRFEKTVRCARCGVHLPMSLARPDHQGHVCADPDCSGRRGHDTEPDHRR